MLFDKIKLNQALSSIGSNYRKILLVNLTDDTYQPITIADDEWAIIGNSNTYRISDYWKWFCNSEFVHEDDRTACLNYKPRPNSHLVYRRKLENEWRWVVMELVPTKEYSESNKSCVLYVCDINNIYISEYESLVEKIGTTDSMTGLYNKFAFERDIQRNKDKTIGVLFGDINGLKATNDKMGHKAGDELIMKFANLLSLNFSGCKIYHISGDEFVVCSFGGSLHDFVSKAIAFHKSMWISMSVPIASIGYSVGEVGEFQIAYDEAEKEMYDDKRIFYSKFPNLKRK